MVDRIDKYGIIHLLGEGHFGKVYCAIDVALNQKKAIKVLNVDQPDDFVEKLKEAEILNKCRHKHIVTINEANIFLVEDKAKVIIDMELISGGSLESIMQRKFISLKEARTIFIDILFGLGHAHKNNILHRDIKPANIMIADNCAKLSDFGLATIVGSEECEPDFGYVSHFAPESMTAGESSILTDIYAAGITLFRVINNLNNWKEIICNLDDLFVLLSKGSLISKIGYFKYVPSKLKRIINKATNKDSRNRYQSADEFRIALEKLTPCIDWVPKSDLLWEGIDKNNVIHSIEITAKSKVFSLEVKKNRRKVTNDCSEFSTMEEAQEAMEDYISETTLE